MIPHPTISLQKKLGIKAGFLCYVHNVPELYFDWLYPLPEPLVFASRLRDDLDFVHIFVTSRSSYQNQLQKVLPRIKQTGMIWVSWPKKASGVVSDVDENVVRELALSNGLVDVKVCAINEVWSGLKLVIPLARRK